MKRAVLAAIFWFILLAPAPAAEAAAQLKPFVRGSWQEVLRSHAGRPTLVHFWGVTCGPCKVELPLLGQFMKEHAGIDMVTISADLVPDLRARHTRDAGEGRIGPAENWIFNDGFVERLRFEIDPAWQGEIPRTMLIARDGTITTIEGSAEMADIEKWFEHNKTPQANEGDVRAGHRQTPAWMIRGTWLRGRTCDGGWKSSFQSYCSRSWCS